MKCNKRLVCVLCVMLSGFGSPVSFAATKDTTAKVAQISVWTRNGDILVQTNPKHDITGLDCTNDYWLTMNKDSPGYEATLSMLLSAQATQQNVIVRAQDGAGDFCTLNRVITLSE